MTCFLYSNSPYPSSLRENCIPHKTFQKQKTPAAPASKKKLPLLTPQKILVILGLLAGVLEVSSIAVDKDQVIEILLEGSLRRRTKLDQLLDEIGEMPFDEVLNSIIRRG